MYCHYWGERSWKNNTEIKNIYDSFPKLKIIFTVSSLLQIYKSTADLSRRVVYEDLEVLLNNTNLSYLYSENANIGSARETFFVNQLSAVANVILAPQGDFMIDNYTFEVGGKGKSFDQIKNIPNSFVVADDIEIGHKNKIPLWMFGFLY